MELFLPILSEEFETRLTKLASKIVNDSIELEPEFNAIIRDNIDDLLWKEN